MKGNKLLILFVVVFAVIVFLPPILHSQELLIINNDTAVHLKTFEALKNGTDNSMYLGQKIVGYPLITLERVTGVSIQTSFMWFNFAVIFVSGILVALLVIKLTKSKIAGIVSAFVITFGIGSTMHLFWSGTIFNIIEFLIILPVFLLLIYLAIDRKKIKWLLGIVPVGVLMFFFHPSLGSGIKYLFQRGGEAVIGLSDSILLFFGIGSFILFAFCVILYYNKRKDWKDDTGVKVVLWILLLGFIAQVILAMLGLTTFSSRMMINAFLFLGLYLCLRLGLVLRHSNSMPIKYAIIALAMAGTIPNLVNWFTWTGFYEGNIV